MRTVRVRAWNGLEERFGVPFPFFTPWLVVAAGREVRRADVVHVHDPLYLTSWVAALWCLVLRTPYVVHRHVGFVHHSSALVRLVQGACSAPSGGWCSAGRGRCCPSTTTSPPACRTRPRSWCWATASTPRSSGPPTLEERSARVPPVALFVGRFVPKKGFALVAAAAGDDYDLVFAGGDRPPGSTTRGCTSSAGSRPRRCRPSTPIADVMVVASVGECPLTVLEAMAAACRCSSTTTPRCTRRGPRARGCASWTWPGASCAGALRTLVADPAEMRRLGDEGHGFVRAAFSWEAHVDRLEGVYRRERNWNKFQTRA